MFPAILAPLTLTLSPRRGDKMIPAVLAPLTLTLSPRRGDKMLLAGLAPSPGGRGLG